MAPFWIYLDDVLISWTLYTWDLLSLLEFFYIGHIVYPTSFLHSHGDMILNFCRFLLWFSNIWDLDLVSRIVSSTLCVLFKF